MKRCAAPNGAGAVVGTDGTFTGFVEVAQIPVLIWAVDGEDYNDRALLAPCESHLPLVVRRSSPPP